jgi:hypothetical protein
MSLFSMLLKEPPPPAGPVDPKWRRNERGYFYRLMDIDVEAVGLNATGGVYAIWHRGVRPEWVYVGHSDKLGASIVAARNNDDIADFEVNGGLYVTWSPIVAEFRDGVVNYLRLQLKPVIEQVAGEHIDESAPPVPVLPPQ